MEVRYSAGSKIGDHQNRARSPQKTVTTGELLREIGEALYGSRWQTEMSLDLGVTNRTVRRWLIGETRPSATVWLDLQNLLDLRAAEQQRVGQKVRAARDIGALIP